MGSERLFYLGLVVANFINIYGINNRDTVGSYYTLTCISAWAVTIALFVRLLREKMRENKAARIERSHPK